MYDDAKSFIRRCSQCQRHGNINTRDAIPLISNLQLDIFDVWGIDFMGSFPNSEGCEYILVAVDYVSKWIEALPCRAADAMHSKKMFHEVIFLRYGVPTIVISDGGSHFIDRTFRKALSKVGVDHRKLYQLVYGKTCHLPIELTKHRSTLRLITGSFISDGGS
jgi:hypothetical protein